jgi:hypothetical protein
LSAELWNCQYVVVRFKGEAVTGLAVGFVVWLARSMIDDVIRSKIMLLLTVFF